MSGTGVQSAMRRRTRPQEDQRRSNINNSNINNNSNNANNISSNTSPNINSGGGRLNPMKILYSHELKINSIHENLKGLNIENIQDKSATISDIKNEIEKNFESRLNIITNNLNYILNGFNELKQSTKILELEIARLTKENKDLANKKLDSDDFLEYKINCDKKNNRIQSEVETSTEMPIETLVDTLVESHVEIEKLQTDDNSEISLEKTLLTDTTDTIGTLESIDINNGEIMDERVNELSVDRHTINNVEMLNNLEGQYTENGDNLNNINISADLVKNLDLKIDDINSESKESIEIVNKTNSKSNAKSKNRSKN